MAAVEANSAALDTRAPTSDVAITTFCGACHVFPQPESFPVSRWRDEVEQGFRIYGDSGRNDLVPSDVEATVAWFERHAKPDYDFSGTAMPSQPDRLFKQIKMAPEPSNVFGCVTHIRSLAPANFLKTDTLMGLVWKTSFDGKTFQREVIGEAADPAHAEPTDLDGDGKVDYVVADLGSFNPAETFRGSLWWFHETPTGWQRIALRLGMSRVCDVRPLDYDGDGDQDLVVAEFGFRFVGSIHLLTNQGLKNGVPQFDWKVIDDRNGAVHVPVVDINHDGKPDIVTLVAQEHEAIEVHLNSGDSTMVRKQIYQAPDPSYGSSGIDIADMDGDGDLDILYTNGDTMDDALGKPFHGIHWLENTGEYPFKHHSIMNMPGVYRAVAGDIDLDGDMDIAAVALLSQPFMDTYPDVQFDGIVWLEQDAGKFSKHIIESDRCDWGSCVLNDVDDDGDLDLISGHFPSDSQITRPITVHRNQTKP
ncbi:VCBS repeat-containing protein [Rubripirellula amarantea]|nr:VCBS repeat-containing protein [Rubripirellula amarantea]